MPNTAEDMIEYEKYTEPGGTERLTRKSTASMEWTIKATGKKVYVIKFDKNFAKKHLYTSSKKSAEILALATKLWEQAGKPAGKSASDYLDEAQKQKDETKFKKQLGHRSKDEQEINCKNCSHPQKSHFTGSGVPTPCKAIESTGTACGCATFLAKLGAYEQKRTDQKKLVTNPLAGAPTSKNTVVWMNKVAKTTFEKVVIDTIIAKETALGSTAWSATGEHINWDFGAINMGCVLEIEAGKDMSTWPKKQGITVTVLKLPSTDADKPIYQVVHCGGGI